MKLPNLILQSTLSMALVLALLVPGRPASYECNKKLLNTFRLKGLKYSVAEEMEICPTVRDTCCSMFDQIEILQLWRKTSFFKVQDHFIEMEKWDDKVMRMYYKFRKLHRSDMVFYYKSQTPAPYLHHFCTFKKTPLLSLPAEVLGRNMEWMLPGRGPIRGVDLKKMRAKAYRRIEKQGVDKTTSSFRFRHRSSKKFYKEFFYISQLMYYKRRLPYYHRKLHYARIRFDKLPLSGKMPRLRGAKLPSDKLPMGRKRKIRRIQRKKATRKPNTYHFTDKHVKGFDNEIQGIYAGNEGRRGRGRGRGRGKKRRKKKNRRLAKKSKSQAEKSKEKGQAEKADADDPNAEIEELHIKRRKKRIPQADKGPKLRYKARVDLKRGRHRRRLTTSKAKRRHNRKLKDLKGKIAKQWDEVFGQKQLPHPNQAFSPQQTQGQMMVQNPVQTMMPQGQMMPQAQAMNRSPTEQGQLQFQNMSYTMTPNGSVPLQTGPAQSAVSPQMVQMYPQGAAMSQVGQPQVGVGAGRILEASHGQQSDKEIMEKLKVTKVALKALKSLKRSYGKHYSRHLKEVKDKVKYFSGYVMHGDPIHKLQVLKKKLEKASQMIHRKRKLKLKRRLQLAKKPKKKKKKKRKLFFKAIGNLFKGAVKAGGKALKDAELLALLETNPSPPLRKVLKITGGGTPKQYLAKLGFGKDKNKKLIKVGVLGLTMAVSLDFLAKKFIMPKADWKKVLGIGANFEPNLKKLNKNVKNAEKTLKKKEKQIKTLTKKLKKSIQRNDREFKAYARTVKLEASSKKRAPNKDIDKLKFDPSVDVRAIMTANSIDCGFQLRTFQHTMANHSPLKQRYCNRVFSNFKRVRIKELRFYTKLARKEMLSILSMKRSLYCGVCDATLQNNFDEKHKLILYSQRFCHDLLSQYKDYIKFRHIILIEFYDQFFQLISCFEFKNELGVDYPYRTMLESQKRRIATIKRCFLNLNTPGFYRYCYFVCSQFNLIKFSKFFDGDLDLLKTLYAKFTMFIRRYKVYRRNFAKHKKKKRGKKRRKRKRKLRMKHQQSLKEALKAPPVETETGVQEAEPKTVKRTRKKSRKKLGPQERQKMRSLKSHLDRVNTSLTDEISMLVLNHKKQASQKKKELADRKKYIEDYQNEIKGKKILSNKRPVESKTAQEAEPKQQIELDKGQSKEQAQAQVKSQQAKAESGLWGRKRVLESDIAQTFSNELQNSFFEQRLEAENQKEAELTAHVKLSEDEHDTRGRDLKLKLKDMKEHTDEDPSEQVNKKIKRPRKKMGFSYKRKKKLTQAQKIRRRITYLRLHTESNRLPKYYAHQINPNLRRTYTETAYSKSIYHKTHLPFAVKTFRAFFASSVHGFNPLRTTEMMRFDFDPRQIIALTRNKNYRPERLSERVIKSYLSFGREDMAGFKNDVNLDFDEYGHTNDKNYSGRSVWPKYKMFNKKMKKPFRRDDSKPFEPQTPQEFSNPDMQDLHGHFRNNTSNNYDGMLWHRLFGR